MNHDIESWLSAITTLQEDAKPDMLWSQEIPESSSNFELIINSSFLSFTEYPSSYIPIDLQIEAKFIDNPIFENRAKLILSELDSLDFSQIGDFAILSIALKQNPDLMANIPNTTQILKIVWCLSQCAESDPLKVLQYWDQYLFHPPPISDRIECQAVLLLLYLCISKLEPTIKPPITSDDFEVVFCLAYCLEQSEVKALAQSVIPQLALLIIESNAAHLLFRRMLPYCSMSNKQGRKMALKITETILSHHERFLSCITTWVSLHPFCLAASNNLLIDMYQRGLITSQMKTVLKHLQAMNLNLLKGKIIKTDEVKQQLPRSLWDIEFPPPIQYIQTCRRTCKTISSSFESKRWLILPVFIGLLILSILYTYL